jgi:CheY-like chemotaxis protein
MNILVVDDENDIEDLFLQKFRHEIRSKEIIFSFRNNGEDALTYLDQHNCEALLILSDINMPGMSGIELLKKIKKQYANPSPSVVMISAYGDKNSKNEAMELGAEDFLSKPVDFEALKLKLKNKLI